MGMNEFRRLGAKIDQHMQRLAAEGINDAPAIINRMMGYVPGLHKIWVETSNDQLIALSNEFPGFYRYALLMEESSEAERNKASRPYDGMAQFPEQHKQLAAQLLTTAATLEGSVALATDERDFRRDECHFLKLDGFALPKYKIGRQKTSRCSPPS